MEIEMKIRGLMVDPSTHMPIVLLKDAQLNVAIFDIPAGATLPVHKHPFPRYAYVLAGTLKVTNQDAGRADIFKKGDFIVEAVDQWHMGTAIGVDQLHIHPQPLAAPLH